MAKLWKRIQELFRQEAQRPSSQPFLHTPIDQPLRTQQEQEAWQASPARSLLYTKVRSAYNNFVHQLPSIGQTIQFVDSAGVDGCIIYCQDLDDVKHRDYLALLEEQKAILDQERYILNVGDVRSGSKGSNLQQTYRYYLKPSMRLYEDGKSHQLFGNVTLLYVTQDNQPLHYRISANTYSDHKYHPPLDFSGLMDKLWQV